MASKRIRPDAGFYRMLHSFSSADVEVEGRLRHRKTLVVGEELPNEVYEVERLVTERWNKQLVGRVLK